MLLAGALLVAGCSSDDDAAPTTTTAGLDGGGGGEVPSSFAKHDPTGGAAHDPQPVPTGEPAEHTVVVRTELRPPESTTVPGARKQATTTTTAASTTAPASSTTTTVIPAGCDSMPNALEVQICEVVDARAGTVMASTSTPGMAIGVVVPGAAGQPPVQLEFHYGDAVVASGSTPEVPVAPDTHWEMGSETKLFTGLLLALLAPTGSDGTCAADATVCLDDPISEHLPADIVSQIGAEKAGITLLQLATHTSGLPDDPPNLYAGCPTSSGGTPKQCANWRALYTDELMWEGVAQSEMAFSPGEAGQWLYSDLGFAILGAILADVADPGQPSNPFASVVADRLTGPLGLTDTGPEDDADPLLAMGYEFEGSSLATTTTGGMAPNVVAAPRWNNTAAFIAGGGFTTDLSDVTRFVAESLGYEPSPLTPALQEMLVERTDGESSKMKMGLAWQMMTAPPFPATYGFKNGGTYGFKSATVVVPSLGYGVTMLSNSPGAPDPVVTGIMSDLRPLVAP